MVWRYLFTIIIFSLLTACSTPERPIFSTDLEMIVSENGFSAQRWYVPAAETIQITVTNRSADNMTLYFLAPSGSKTPREAWFSLPVSAGESKQASFTTPAAAGEYDITAELETDPKMSQIAEIVVVQP